MEYLYTISVDWEGRVFILSKEVIKITDKSIICDGARYNRDVLDKITMHNCTYIGQSAMYTLDANKIQEYIQKIKHHYKSIWEEALKKINKKMLTIDEKPIEKYLSKENKI